MMCWVMICLSLMTDFSVWLEVCVRLCVWMAVGLVLEDGCFLETPYASTCRFAERKLAWCSFGLLVDGGWFLSFMSINVDED